MIKLLKYLASTLEQEQLYNLAMFLSDNPDIIDQETLMHIINEVDNLESQGVILDNSQLDDVREHFNKKDGGFKRFNDELNNLLDDNNIGLN